MAGVWTPNRWSSWNAPWGRRLKLAAGTMVTPRLRLVRPLGETSGNVWVADHLGLQTQVAVKFHGDPEAELDEGEGADGDDEPGSTPPPGAERFARQAFVAGRLSEAHLVKIVEQGVAKGAVPFIVSELLEGKSLRQRLLQSGSLGLLQAQDVLQQVAAVLSKAHSLGLSHGSLCPDHLFWVEVASRPFIKILNFGDIPPALGDEAPNPRRHAYLSPEQLGSGRGNSAESDLWALAVTIYELLTTTLPFEASTPEELSGAICSAEFAPPSRYRADLPGAVDHWFLRALAKDPLRRYQSASELALGFARALVDEVERPSSPSAAQHSAPSRATESAPASSVNVGPGLVGSLIADSLSLAPPGMPGGHDLDVVERLGQNDTTDGLAPAQSGGAEPEVDQPSMHAEPELPRFESSAFESSSFESSEAAAAASHELPPRPELATLPLIDEALADAPPVRSDRAPAIEDDDDEGEDETTVNAESLLEDDDDDDDEEELTRKWEMPAGWSLRDGVPERISSLPPPLPARRSSRPPAPPNTGSTWAVDARPRPSLALTALTGVASPTGAAARSVSAAPSAEPRTVVARAVATAAPGWPSAKTKVLLSALLASLCLLTTWRFMKASAARARDTNADTQNMPSATAALSPADSASSTVDLTSKAAAERDQRRREAALKVIRTEDLPPVPEEAAVLAADVAPVAALQQTSAAPAQIAALAPPAAPRPAAAPMNQTARAVAGALTPAPKPAAIARPKPAPAPPKASRKAAPAKATKAAANCSPPYYFDKNNIRRLKLECL